MKITFISLAIAAAFLTPASAELVVTLRGTEPEGASVRIAKPAITMTKAGSSTSSSARFKTNKAMVNGAMETDRDFGQTFTTGSEAFYLDRITVKLGDQPVAPTVFGAEVSVQIFEVSGRATVNDNGTITGKVTPWSDDPRVDDFIEGETFTPLTTARNGRLPAFLLPGQLMVFNFLKADRMKLKPNTHYGYIFMFDNAAPDRSLSFAAIYWSDYAGGHAMRRDSSVTSDLAKRTAVLPTMKPGTKSDVYSDAIFWVEGADAPAASAVVTNDVADGTLPLPRR